VPTHAEPEVLARLLDLQSHDSAIRVLEHRKEGLPEARRLAEVNEHLAELEADIGIAQDQRSAVARDQARLEGEIDLLGQKIAREEKRLFSGSVANPKELGSLQAEVKMLQAKRTQLEDSLLELMVRRDEIDETLAKLEEERAGAAADAAHLSEEVRGLVGEIDAELSGHGTARAELATGIPDDVLALYDRIRRQQGGVGAAALVGGTCQGCHTQLPAREVERLRASGGLQRCDSCRRILVVV
jgi:predicted  nucleic acid-binding Zn-ribbon protein